MKSWEEIKEKHVLRSSLSGREGDPVVQFCFTGDVEGTDFLIEHCAQSIRVFPFTKSWYETWLADSAHD